MRTSARQNQHNDEVCIQQKLEGRFSVEIWAAEIQNSMCAHVDGMYTRATYTHHGGTCRHILRAFRYRPRILDCEALQLEPEGSTPLTGLL